VLKFGAMIVDELRTYRQPVFVYIPPGGELRGGAWVVVDPTINLEKMEMYADVDARGGILEPPGICEVKYRKGDQIKAMHRLDPLLKELDADPEANKDAIQAREEQLLPVYLQIAHEFADLHDRAGRMEAKGVIRQAVEWKHARKYFHSRLMRRLQEDHLRAKLQAANSSLTHDELTAEIKALAGEAYDNDDQFRAWIEGASAKVSERAAELTAVGTTAAVNKLLDGLAPEARAAVIAAMK